MREIGLPNGSSSALCRNSRSMAINRLCSAAGSEWESKPGRAAAREIGAAPSAVPGRATVATCPSAFLLQCKNYRTATKGARHQVGREGTSEERRGEKG